MGLDSYEVISVVGTGAFGYVHLCRRKADNIEFVFKNITGQFKDDDEIKVFKNEVSIISALDHPNIIKYHDSFLSTENNAVLVMEFANRGTLNDYVKEQVDNLIDQEVVLPLFCQLCLAVQYLHNKNIIHRDITAHNVLLSGQSRLIVKLSDFGVSKYIQRRRLSSVDNTIGEALKISTQSSTLESMISSAGVIGTQEYIAPEVCYGQPHSKASDVWSLGCILYLLMTLKLPFSGENLYTLVMKITNSSPDFKKIDRTVYDEELITVTSNLLLKEPLHRTKLEALLSHPYLLRHVINIGVNYK